MKRLMLSISASMLLAALSPTDVWANPQHERMKRCSQEAKEKTLKGDERKQFMSTCLKGKHTPSTAAPSASAGEKLKASAEQTPTEKAPVIPVAKSDSTVSAQKDLTKECNRAAKEKTLKGAERKSFINECLKG